MQQAASQAGKTMDHKKQSFQRATLPSNFARGLGGGGGASEDYSHANPVVGEWGGVAKPRKTHTKFFTGYYSSRTLKNSG
jgi:hypothetical protein